MIRNITGHKENGRNYCVQATAGGDYHNLTKSEAYGLALKLWKEWRDIGREVVVAVYYQPTGGRVPQDRWLD